MASNNQIKFGVGYLVDKASILKVKQSLRDLQSIKIGDFKGTELELQNIQKTAKAVESALTQAFNPTLNTANIETFNSVLKQSGRTIDTVYADFAKLGSQGRQAFTQVTSQIMTTNTQLRLTRTLLTTMGLTMMNTIKWGIASSIINTFTQSVRQSVEYVKNLDSALTDIRIVTGDSTLKMKEFAVQANQAAQALGRSTMDYSKAALTFYQQGLSDEDVQARTQATLKAQNITGAGDEMADYLTAVWNGYKVANEEALLYVDKLAAVADSSASNMALLATAMSKVASTANMLGVPVDKLNAQIATITATTRQAPETVGNALKTIYARINDIATGADDALISLGNYSSKMAEVGFSVLDASGHLRDTGDVIDEIGAKWGTLSREQQIYLARTMAGQRQYNNLLALFENWGRYTDLVTVSMDSQGATMEKNSRYLESLAAKTEQYRAAQERVKSALISENDLKGIVDFGTKATNIFASLVEGIGGGRNAMLALGSIVTSVFGNIIGKLIGNAIVKSRLAKASFLAMAEAINNTKTMQQSIAYKDPDNKAYKLYVDNLREVQRTWSVLTVEEKKAQQQRALDIATLSEQKKELKENQKAAEELAQAFSKKANLENNFRGAQTSLKLLNTIINQGKLAWSEYWSNATENINYQSVLNNLTSIQEKMGKSASDLPFFDLLTKAASGVALTREELDSLNNQIDQFYAKTSKTTNFAINISKSKEDLVKLQNQLKQLQADFEKTNKSASTVFNTQQIIGFVSGVGRVASSINTITNLIKSWKSDISLGLKLLQTLTSVGFMLPMFLSGLSSIWKSLGLNLTIGKAIKNTKQQLLITQKLQSLEEEKQALYAGRKISELSKEELQRLKSLLIQKQELRILKEKAVTLEGILALLKAQNAERIKAILGILPVVALVATSIAAVAMVVKSIVDDYNKAKNAALQANKLFLSANKIYKDTKQSIDDLKSSWDSLQSARNNLNELTTGTELWKSALEEVNNQVMNLILKYPELAQYAKVGANGAMEISELGYQAFLAQQQKTGQVNALITASARERQTSANNNYTIQLASRGMGLGIFNNTLLTNLVDAINNGNTNLLDNETLLKNLTNGNQDLIDKIQNHKDLIIKLAENVKDNTDKTQALTTAMIESEIIDPELVAKSYNPAAFSKVLADQYLKGGLARQQRWLEENNISKGAGAITSQLSSQDLQTLSQISNQYANDAQGRLTARAAYLDSIGANYEAVFSDEDKQKILNIYKELNSDIADHIQYDGGDLILILDLTGKKVEDTLRFEDIVSALADVDAKIDYDSWLNKFNTLAEQFGSEEFASQMVGAATKTAEAGKIAIQDLLLILADPEKIRQIAKATGKSATEVQKNIELTTQKTNQSLYDYFDSIPNTVESAIKNLGGGAGTENQGLTEEIQKMLGSGFLKAASLYGQRGINSIKALFRMAGEDGADLVAQAFSTIDFSTPEGLLQLELALANIGDGSLTALASWQDFKAAVLGTFFENPLDKAFNQEENIQKILKDTKKYSVVNEEDYNTLLQINPEIEKLFARVAGGYELIESKGKLSDLLVGDTSGYIQAADAYDALQESAQELGNRFTTGLQDSILKGDKLPQIAQYIANSIGDNDSLWSALGTNILTVQYYINNFGDEVLHADEWLQNFLTTAQNASNTFSDISLSLRTAAALDALSLSLLNYLLDLGKISGLDYALALQKVSDTEMENLGFDVDQYEDFVKILQSTNEELEDNEYLARAAARTYMRVLKGMSDLIDNFLDWNDALLDFKENGDFSNLIENWGLMKEALANLFDTDLLVFDMLGPDFVANNLDKIQAVKDGVEGAYEELDALMDQQLVLLAYGVTDFSQLDEETQKAWNTIQELNGQLIQIGAVVDDADAMAAFQRIADGAHWSSALAQAAFAEMGYDIEVEEKLPGMTTDTEATLYYVPPKYKMVPKPFNLGPFGKGNLMVPELEEGGHYESAGGGTKQTYKPGEYAIKTITKNGKGFGGNISRNVQKSTAPRSSKGSGGGGGGGGKGSQPKQATIAKPSTETITTKPKELFINPYEAVLKSYDRQEKQLKKLNDIEKDLDGKERLLNLKKQNKTLEQQNKTIEKRQKISDDAAKKGTTAYYRNQIERQDKVLKKVAKFDEDGQLNLTATKNAAVKAYNDYLKEQKDDFEAKKKEYLDWIENTWNKYSGDEQEAHKKDKLERDEQLKNAKKQAEDNIKLAEEEYNKRIKLIEDYEKALEEDLKFYETYVDNIRQIIENKIEASKIKVDLSLDFGLLERDFLDFRNKVVKKIAKDDILGNTKALRDQINSYYNSNLLTNMADRIKSIRNEMATMQAGGYSNLYGISREQFDLLKEEDRKALQDQYLKQAKEDLEKYTKEYMDALEEIQDARDKMYDNYLDSIDDVKDKMEEVVDQYDRINDLLEHRVKITQMLFGDNAGFGTLDKYYDKQEKNNLKQMLTLRRQLEYWRDLMNSAEVGSDSWKKFKENYEDVVDQINAALENQLDLIAEKFLNKIQQAIKNVTTSLTHGLGNDYLEQEWDYISKDDDAFLDVVNSKFGIDEVQQLYTDALDAAAGSPTQQRKINALMQDQLKILREKDKLTQYDIDRAKAALEVEKARMALEDSRNQKTKMRLRRDSQGNYTYQYVRDEEKLSDLQSALADAQSELYNMDKEHYKQQLNLMYSTYKEYLLNMALLERQYEATNDAAEKKRLQAQMDLLRDKFSDYFDNINEDLQYNLTNYLTKSFTDAMGLSLDGYTSAEAVQILKENLPYTNSEMQTLSETIRDQGGIVQATADYYREMRDAVKEAAAAQKEVLSTAGISLGDIVKGKDSEGRLSEVTENIEYYKDTELAAENASIEVKNLLDEMDKFLGINFHDQSDFVEYLQDAYDELQRFNDLLGENGGNILGILNGLTYQDYLDKNSRTTSLMTDFNAALSQYLKYSGQADEILDKLPEDIKSLSVSQAAKYAADLQNYLSKMQASYSDMELIGQKLEQDVNIQATFPNVENSKLIENAIDNLLARASQKTSSSKKK